MTWSSEGRAGIAWGKRGKRGKRGMREWRNRGIGV
jgi:hypothetical protein